MKLFKIETEDMCEEDFYVVAECWEDLLDNIKKEMYYHRIFNISKMHEVDITNKSKIAMNGRGDSEVIYENN